MKKTLWTLDVDNYEPEITKRTRPLQRHWAEKMGADYQIITERRFKEAPVVYEKLQIFEKGFGNDWNIYLDADALVHPDMFDITEHLRKDTVLHNGKDMAGNRFVYDMYFRRDGRHIGSGNWFTAASSWCLDLWRPLEIPLQSAVDRIFPIAAELAMGMTPEHLIDDFTLSRNIAKYGLKFKTFTDLKAEIGRADDDYFFHNHLLKPEDKLKQIDETLKRWGVETL